MDEPLLSLKNVTAEMMRSAQTGLHVILPISQTGNKASVLDHPRSLLPPCSLSHSPNDPLSAPDIGFRVEHTETVLKMEAVALLRMERKE